MYEITNEQDLTGIFAIENVPSRFEISPISNVGINIFANGLLYIVFLIKLFISLKYVYDIVGAMSLLRLIQMKRFRTH